MKFTHPRQIPADDFLRSARQLLPPGDSVSKDPRALIQKIIAAFGLECHTTAQRAADAMDTANPATPGEMLAEWLRAVNTSAADLVPVLTEVAIKTIDEMRAKFPFYEIDEVKQTRSGFLVGEELAVNAVRVKFPATPRYFHCGDVCGSPLKRTPGVAEVRAAIRRYLPAHIRLNVAIRTSRYLLCHGRPLTCNGRHITI